MRRVVHGQRCQVIRAALLQLQAQVAHRARGALHHHKHHQRDHRHQRQLPPQGVQQNLPGQGAAQFQRFGHLDHRHAARAFNGDGLQQHGHAHGITAVHIVVKIDQRGIGPQRGQLTAP